MIRLGRAVLHRLHGTLLGTWLRAAHSALLGEMPVLAAGTALFTILATVPVIAALVSLYGLVADPAGIESHLRGLETVLPAAVVDFVIDQLARQATRSGSELVGTIVTSLVIALYSARGAAAALMGAFNQVYRVRENRTWLHRLGISVMLAGTTLIGLILLATLLVGLPALLSVLPLPARIAHLTRYIRWPILFTALLVAQMALYWVAPATSPGTRRRLLPGAFVGTVLWMVVSFALSLWVDRVANYAAFYGAFASAIVVLLWFYASVITILIGGFVNAELERQNGGAPPPVDPKSPAP